MGSFPSANPSLPTSIPGIYEPPSAVVGVVPVASGGTGATTAAAGLAALGGALNGLHTLKTGLGGGNVNFTSATLAKLFGTELDITQTIPVGMLAVALCFWSQVGPNSGNLSAGIAVDGAIASGLQLIGGSSSQDWAAAAMALLVGDGASHVFSPQGFVSAGTAVLLNQTAGGNYLPLHLLLVLGSA